MLTVVGSVVAQMVLGGFLKVIVIAHHVMKALQIFFDLGENGLIISIK